MNDPDAAGVRPARRPLPVSLLAVIYVLLGLVFAGMAIQDLSWNEFKPGKPMDPDLVPWAIGLLCLAGAFLGAAVGLFRMRQWGRRIAIGLAAFLVLALLYGLTEDAPLLALLITPGFALFLGLLYLLRPAAAARFRN